MPKTLFPVPVWGTNSSSQGRAQYYEGICKQGGSPQYSFGSLNWPSWRIGSLWVLNEPSLGREWVLFGDLVGHLKSVPVGPQWEPLCSE